MLSSVYEMSGIRPPSESVERWIVAGWPHVCQGLTVESVQEAFMLCMAGRLVDTDGEPVSLDLYGRQFALQDFAKVIGAYRHMLAEARLKEMQRQAVLREEELQRRREELSAADKRRMHVEVIRRAYTKPDVFRDWGGVTYKRIEAAGLLDEVAGRMDDIRRKAAAEVADFDPIRAVLDRRYREKHESAQPDIEGETVREWFRKQAKDGLSLEDVLHKLNMI